MTESPLPLPAPLPAPAGPAGPQRLAPYLPLLVVAMAWAAQGGVLGNGWVWDDAILVRDGSAVARGFAAIPTLLFRTWGGGDGIDVGLYRPLVGASLAIQAGIHGVSSPFPFHLLNLFLHGSVAVAFLALLHRLLPTRPVVTSVAALLFAATPLHTGTVSWIVARGDLLAALFCLLAALAWTRRKGLDVAAVVLAAVLWFLALLSKEMAVTLPLVLLGIDAYGREEGGRGVGVRGVGVRGVGAWGALRTRWMAYAALLVPLAAYLALRQQALGSFLPEATAPLAGRPMLERLFLGAGALVRMAAKIAVPAGLAGDASNDPMLGAARPDLPFPYVAAFAVVISLAVMAAVRRARGRGGLATFSWVAFGVLALPVLQIVPIGAVFEDRFAYLPSLALLPLLGLAAERLWCASPPALSRGLLCVAMGALLPASWSVAADWRDELAFDRALLEDDAGHAKALDRIAGELMRLGLEDRRRAQGLRATDREQGVREELHVRSAARLGEALRLLERARTVPGGATNPSTLRSLADAYLLQPSPRFGEAGATYRELLSIKRVRVAGRWVPWDRVKDLARVLPADRAVMAQIYDNLAAAEIGYGSPDELVHVADARERAARWTPNDYERARLSGAAWMTVDDPARALPRLERALEVAPASEVLGARAALLEVRESAHRRAQEAFERGVAANHRVGAHQEALAAFEEAVRLDPNFPAAHVERAVILRYKGNIRGALDALHEARASLDTAGAAADAPERKRVQELTAKYEKDEAEPDK